MSIHELTPNAKALLAELRNGANVANPPANIGEFAYSALAQAFFSNARGLCRDDGLSDFRVYGALYSLRHGLELMLKCIVRNDLMDTTLGALMTAAPSFDDVCRRLALDAREKKRERKLLQQSLCTIRNVIEDELTFPDSRTKNIDAASADRAVRFLQKNPNLPRDRFAIAWSSTAFGHDLSDLWAQATSTVEAMAADAKSIAQEIGFPPPLAKPEIERIVELLAALDDGGDGFRYPSSLDGAWYVELPAVSLEALGALASELESTCSVFESVREHCYGMATIGHPTPQYHG
jgi:hypothetical protein